MTYITVSKGDCDTCFGPEHVLSPVTGLPQVSGYCLETEPEPEPESVSPESVWREYGQDTIHQWLGPGTELR